MNASDMVWLRRQWDDLMQLYGLNSAQTESVFADLVAHYEGDGRYYHNLQHIQNVLEIIESVRTYANDVAAIKLAAWFHDVVYDVQRSDNETQSAIYAANVLKKLGIDAATITKVSRMIRATKHNRGCPEDIDCQIMLDADLATFASDWDLQIEIEEAIRQEFAFVPDDAYREGRKVVLQNFLRRDRIYCTEVIYNEREAWARRNIERAIEALGEP
jgi:predicted metal-dependent HD superfamily phosphohydrolase